MKILKEHLQVLTSNELKKKINHRCSSGDFSVIAHRK